MKYPWMPLFWGDFLANTMHLSTQEVGAYFLLIAHAWEHGAKVRVKDAQRITRVDNRHWAKVRTTLAPFFDPPDGLRGSASEVVHRRCAKELANSAELSNKRKGAAMQMHENRRANLSVVHVHPQSLPLPESTSVREEAETVVDYRDKGPAYRAPPKRKVETLLMPLPERRRTGV